MVTSLTLPRLVSGPGALAMLMDELHALRVERPLLISDRGLERAGLVGQLLAILPPGTAQFLDVPENPIAAGADAAVACYRSHRADGIVALGGGSVLDTAKIVAAVAVKPTAVASDLIGRPELVGPEVAPLVAVPTTLGTGSESSPVAGLHLVAGGPVIGTRTWRLVPRLALCDPDLTRTLPRRLIAATGIDALSHCIEGYFANPPNPFIDALALDGMGRAFASLPAALEPDGGAARASLMVAAYAGGVAIHKGLGTAHAVAVTCGEQDLHHGTLVGIALPAAVRLVAANVPEKADRVAAALGLRSGQKIGDALLDLNRRLGLPTGLREIGFRPGPIEGLVAKFMGSPFNRSSAYVPSEAEYRQLAEELLA